jgi:sugar lactone lactonase YvrE
LYSQADIKPLNDLPQPYRTVRDWGHPRAAAMGGRNRYRSSQRRQHLRYSPMQRKLVCRTTEPPILKFDKSGKLLKVGARNVCVSHGATLDRQGNLWVTDAQIRLERVIRCSNSVGRKASDDARRSQPPALSGLFDEPTDVAVTANGDIFITEGHSGGTKGNDRVQKFSADGKFVTMWGKTGSGHGELNNPHTIALDSRGRLLVGDRSNNRIEIFNQDGQYLDTWYQWGRPSGIFIAKDDTMYVADSESWGPDQPGWKKGIRIGSAKDGSVKYFIEDMESTTIDHSGAEAVGVDASGNVYGGVVRRQMLEKHIPK